MNAWLCWVRRLLWFSCLCNGVPPSCFAGPSHPHTNANSWLQVRKVFHSGVVSDVAQNQQGADYVLTWQVPQTSPHASQAHKQFVNVSFSEARQLTGPLTLLFALSRSEAAGPLSLFLQRAREKRRAAIHIVGASSDLEPHMLWERFLVGPLSTRDEQIVETFRLPRTPLAGVKFSMLFNGDEINRHRRSRHHGRTFTPGFYHKKVREVPDLVIAINPGFAHYAQDWWPTLRHLQGLQVPILATGFKESFMPGNALPALYKVTGGHGGKRTISAVNFDSTGTTSRHSSELNICNDQDGNELVARNAGYTKTDAGQNPFIFCHLPDPHGGFPWKLSCDGSAVFSVLLPRARAKVPKKAPVSLMQQVLHRSLPCYPVWQRHQRCMVRRLAREPPRRLIGLNDLVDSYLDKIAKHCS